MSQNRKVGHAENHAENILIPTDTGVEWGQQASLQKPLLTQMSIIPPSRGDPVGNRACDRRPSTRRYMRGPYKGEDTI